MTGAGTGTGTGTGHTALLDLRPQLRTDIVVSPPVLRGTATIRLIKDPRSGRRFELRAKEHFILDRLDGSRTLAEIGDEYAAHFGARLGEPQWRRLLRLVYDRGLTTDAPTPSEEPTATGAAAGAADRKPSGLLSGNVRLVADAPSFIERLYRATAYVRTPYALVPVLLALVAMAADLAVDFGELQRGAAYVIGHPALLLAVLTLLWSSQGLHELGHGVAGRAFGAGVGEIGLRWHWGTVLMYCRVEDVQFFARRREQVATACAGVFVNLLILLPFWVAFMACAPASQARRLLGGLLLIGMAAALVNLLPLPPLDGYLALGYGLGVSRLATESNRFLKLLAARAIGRGAGLAAYPARLRALYGTYGALSVALAAGLGVTAVLVSRRILTDHFGRSAGLVPVVLVAAAIGLWIVGLAAAGSKRRRQGAQGSQGTKGAGR